MLVLILFLSIVIILLIFRCIQSDCHWLKICHSLHLSSYSSKEEVLKEIKGLKGTILLESNSEGIAKGCKC